MAAYKEFLSVQLEGPLDSTPWRLLKYERLDGSADTTGAAATALASLFDWRVNITQAMSKINIRPSLRNASTELAAVELNMIRRIESLSKWKAYERSEFDLL